MPFATAAIAAAAAQTNEKFEVAMFLSSKTKTKYNPLHKNITLIIIIVKKKKKKIVNSMENHR